jgi:hypothetical protein
MIPLACRIFIYTASLLVPRSKREEWKREWKAELWHRAEAGAAPKELLRRAAGVFRDAAWFAESERKIHGFDVFRKPLRTEAAFLASAILICLVCGGFRPPSMPYSNAERLVAFERNVAFAGSDPRINPRLLKVWKQGSSFSSLVSYRILREPEFGVHVASEFFEVLGVPPFMGRSFKADDGDDVVVVPYDVWRTRFHAKPDLSGSLLRIGWQDYRVIGVMPKDFWFHNKRIRFFAPFPARMLPGGVVARLKPGVSIPAAQTEVRLLAKKVETRWISDAFALMPLLKDFRVGNLLLALQISLIASLLATAFLVVKRLGGWRYWSFLGARVFIALIALCFLRQSFGNASSLFGFWIFLLICSAVVFLLVIDHRGRCPVCLGQLRKPVAIGSYASQFLDQPATEYLCPEGHGTLYVAETGNAPDYWTELDESWQEFFVHSDQ